MLELPAETFNLLTSEDILEKVLLKAFAATISYGIVSTVTRYAILCSIGKRRNRHKIRSTVNMTWTAIGFFLGFGFGVGCALAVMYSIYMGGYRAAIKDGALAPVPERLVKARRKLNL